MRLKQCATYVFLDSVFRVVVAECTTVVKHNLQKLAYTVFTVSGCLRLYFLVGNVGLKRLGHNKDENDILRVADLTRVLSHCAALLF